MKLKDLLPKSLYLSQKKLFKQILDGGKRELKKRADEVYIIQKEVIADIQKEVEKDVVVKAKSYYIAHFDDYCTKACNKIPFFGRFISSILKKYKKEIYEVIFNG